MLSPEHRAEVLPDDREVNAVVRCHVACVHPDAFAILHRQVTRFIMVRLPGTSDSA